MSARVTNRIETLLANYRRRVALPWATNLAGAQRVWFALYPREDERRLRFRIPDFESETKAARHGWKLYDLTPTFPAWMAGYEYRDAHFGDLTNFNTGVRGEFQEHIIVDMQRVISAGDVDQNTVVALLGVGSLFGVVAIADVIKAAAKAAPGRLLVFFPGTKTDNNTYKLLDAAVAWNYLAEAIPSDQGMNA